MKNLLLLVVFCASQSPLCSFAASEKPVDNPKVLLEEIKLLEDKKRIIVPVKVEAKIQSMVSADMEGHVTRILKPLGSSVKAGETILFLENKDPGFTYAAVPVKSPVSGVVSQIWTTQMAQLWPSQKLQTLAFDLLSIEHRRLYDQASPVVFFIFYFPVQPRVLAIE